MREPKASLSGFGISLSVLSMTFLLLSAMAGPLISEKLITAPLTSNSTYGVTFPALDYISDQDEPSVIAIGSSHNFSYSSLG